MGDDFEDTVLVPPRTAPEQSATDIDDTIVRDAAVRATTATPVSPAPPVEAAAPQGSRSQYAVRVGLAGEIIALDVPCYVGRRPRQPRIVPGVSPRLVKVASPRKEVSSTHLEARQVGSAVVVTDLKSTNGTIVLAPGSRPRTLRQGESLVVSPGTLIDLGDDVVIQVLALRASDSAEAGASA